jgi:SAM-dependent methyltransferase
MKLNIKNIPRLYKVGNLSHQLTIADFGTIELDDNEQISFTTESGGEHQVIKKDWGFYATSSLNYRLKNFGIRGCLVKNILGRLFLMLVEEKKVNEFLKYLELDNQKIVCWLDDDNGMNTIIGAFTEPAPDKCPMCYSLELELLFEYDQPNGIEKEFKVTNSKDYLRKILRCRLCGHCKEKLDYEFDNFYEHEYVDCTYKNQVGIERAFIRINLLDPLKSDNVLRVKRIIDYFKDHYENNKISIKEFKLLDVGSGLGVFPYQMKKNGWKCTAIDMDERLVKHHEECIGISSILGDLRKIKVQEKYNLITFNKVLEHIDEPIEMLKAAKSHLKKNGLIYIELPDAESAAIAGKDREEFYIGHIHIFSFTSFASLAMKAGMNLLECRRIREPSGKYTLYGFLSLKFTHFD